MAISARRTRATTLRRAGPLRAVLRGFLLLAVIALLAGCSPTDAPAGLSSAERAVIRSEIQGAHWRVVTTRFPDARRPAVTVTHTVHDGNWQALIIACLRSEGFTVFVDGRYFQFGTTPDRGPEDFAVVSYVCLSRYPTADEVMHYLDRDRLDALYWYYAGTVRPCLLLAGAESTPPPTRFAFVLSALSRNNWNPYRLAWDGAMPAARLAFLEQLCPPVPGWLDLAQ